MKKSILKIALFLFILGPITLNAQEKGLFGISGTVQNSQFGISLPVWVGEKIALVPGFNFRYAQTIGTDFSVGLSSRFYFRNEKLAPYFALQAATAINIPSPDNNVVSSTEIDWIGGAAFGAEYFIGERFSMGLEAQGNLTKSGANSFRFGNPGNFNFNTATLIVATIYLNK